MLKIIRRSSITIFLLIGCIVFFANSVNAEEKKFYVGVGGSYQWINFDYEDAIDWDESSWGINAKFGYRLSPGVSFQFDVDYIPEVEGVLKSVPSIDGEVEVQTAILSFKGYFPNSRPVKPFVIAGVGILHYDIDPNDIAKSLFEIDDNDTGVCFKVGGGTDVFINESVSIGLEVSYTAGTDKVKDVEYWNFILGAAYHF